MRRMEKQERKSTPRQNKRPHPECKDGRIKAERAYDDQPQQVDDDPSPGQLYLPSLSALAAPDGTSHKSGDSHTDRPKCFRSTLTARFQRLPVVRHFVSSTIEDCGHRPRVGTARNRHSTQLCQAPVDASVRSAEKSFKAQPVYERFKHGLRAAQEGKMAVPMCRVQQALVRGEDALGAIGKLPVACFQIINPVQRALRAEFVSHPGPLVPDTLKSIQDQVMQQV